MRCGFPPSFFILQEKQTNKQVTLPFLFADMRGQKGLPKMHIPPPTIRF